MAHQDKSLDTWRDMRRTGATIGFSLLAVFGGVCGLYAQLSYGAAKAGNDYVGQVDDLCRGVPLPGDERRPDVSERVLSCAGLPGAWFGAALASRLGVDNSM